MQNAPAFRLQSTKTERRVRVCEFLNRTLFLHLPAEFIQRLDMPQAFAGNGAKGQGTKEVHEKNFRNAELQSLLKGFQRPAAAPAVDVGRSWFLAESIRCERQRTVWFGTIWLIGSTSIMMVYMLLDSDLVRNDNIHTDHEHSDK